MKSERSLKIRNLYPMVIITMVLLLISIYLSYRNSEVIKDSRSISEEAERVAVNTNNIIRYLHLADIGLRGYALVQENPRIRNASDTAKAEIQRTLSALEQSLEQQGFPHVLEYNDFKQAVEEYFSFVDSMFAVIDQGQTDVFIDRLAKDPGYSLYLRHVDFSGLVNQFENEIAFKADENYRKALRYSYLIQVVIFFLAIPLLFFGAYQTNQVFGISERLRKSEIDRRKLLAEQNVQLERLVYDRTKEIQVQNEEIQAQNEEITLHNEQLELQRREIESKNQIIEESNRDLQKEVERQTVDLRNANTELVEHNNRLKQFSYIVSHNLRAPVARILGLGAILRSSKSEQEADEILTMITGAIHDLDQVIRDINLILEIERMNTQILDQVPLKSMVEKTLDLLKPELEVTQSMVSVDLSSIVSVNFLIPYMESILYNLLSNAVKYRNPERRLEIEIRAEEERDFVRLEIKDNGLGIDLEKYGQDLFKLYKRFHTHVEGKGLGLYLVKTQLSALGGKLKVESQPNVGTTFFLYFKRNI